MSWSCPVCTFANLASDSVCTMCGQGQRSGAGGGAPAAAVSDDPVLAAAQAEWTALTTMVTLDNNVQYASFRKATDLVLEHIDEPDAATVASMTFQKVAELIRDHAKAAQMYLGSSDYLELTGGLLNGIKVSSKLLSKGIIGPSAFVSALLAKGLKIQLFYDQHYRNYRAFLDSFTGELIKTWVPAATAAMESAVEAGVMETLGVDDASTLLLGLSAVIKTVEGFPGSSTLAPMDTARARDLASAFVLGLVDVPQRDLVKVTAGADSSAILRVLNDLSDPADPVWAVSRGYLVHRFFTSSRLGERIFGTKLLAAWASGLMRAEGDAAKGAADKVAGDIEEQATMLSSAVQALLKPEAAPPAPPAEGAAAAAAASSGAAAASVPFGSQEGRKLVAEMAARHADSPRLTCEGLASWIQADSGLGFLSQLMAGSMHSSVMQVAGPVVSILARVGKFGRSEVRSVWAKILVSLSGEAKNLRQLLVDVAAHGPKNLALWLLAFVRDQADTNFAVALRVSRALAAKGFKRSDATDHAAAAQDAQGEPDAGSSVFGVALPAQAAASAAATTFDFGGVADGAGLAEAAPPMARALSRQETVDGIVVDMSQSVNAALDDLLWHVTLHSSAPQLPALGIFADPMGERGTEGFRLTQAMAEADELGPYTFSLANQAAATSGAEGAEGADGTAHSEADRDGSSARLRELEAGVVEISTRLVERARESCLPDMRTNESIRHLLQVVGRCAQVIRESLIDRARAIVAAGREAQYPELVAAAREQLSRLRLVLRNRACLARGLPPVANSPSAVQAWLVFDSAGEASADSELRLPTEAAARLADLRGTELMSEAEVEAACGQPFPPAMPKVKCPRGPRLPRLKGSDPVLRCLGVLMRAITEPQPMDTILEPVQPAKWPSLTTGPAGVIASANKLACETEFCLDIVRLVQLETAAEAAVRASHDMFQLRGRFQAVYVLSRHQTDANLDLATIFSFWAHAAERTPVGRHCFFEFLFAAAGGARFLPRALGDIGDGQAQGVAKLLFDDGCDRNSRGLSESLMSFGDSQLEVRHLSYFLSLFRQRHPLRCEGWSMFKELFASPVARVIMRSIFGPGQQTGTGAGASAAPEGTESDAPAAAAAAAATSTAAGLGVSKLPRISPARPHELGNAGTRALIAVLLASNIAKPEVEGGITLYNADGPVLERMLVVFRDGAADVEHIEAIRARCCGIYDAEAAKNVKIPPPPAGAVRAPPGSVLVSPSLGLLAKLCLSGTDVLRHVVTNASPSVARIASDWLFQLGLMLRPYKSSLPEGERFAPQSEELIGLRRVFRERTRDALSSECGASEHVQALRAMSRAPDAIEQFLDTMMSIRERVPQTHSAAIGKTARASTALMGTLTAPGDLFARDNSLESFLADLERAPSADAAGGSDSGVEDEEQAVDSSGPSMLARQPSIQEGVFSFADGSSNATLANPADPADLGSVVLLRPSLARELHDKLAPLALPCFDAEDYETIFAALQGGDDTTASGASTRIPAQLQLRLWHLLMRLPTEPSIARAVSSPADADWAELLGQGGWRALYTLQIVSALLSSPKQAEPAAASRAESRAKAFVASGGLAEAMKQLMASDPELHSSPGLPATLDCHPVEAALRAATAFSVEGKVAAPVPKLARMHSLTNAVGSADLAQRLRRSIAAGAVGAFRTLLSGLHASGGNADAELAACLNAAGAEGSGAEKGDSPDGLQRIARRLVSLLSEVAVQSLFEARLGGSQRVPDSLADASRCVASNVLIALAKVGQLLAGPGGSWSEALGNSLFSGPASETAGSARSLLRAAFLSHSSSARSSVVDKFLRPIVIHSAAARHALSPVILAALASLNPAVEGGEAIVEMLVAASQADGAEASRELAVRLVALLAHWFDASEGATPGVSGMLGDIDAEAPAAEAVLKVTDAFPSLGDLSALGAAHAAAQRAGKRSPLVEDVEQHGASTVRDTLSGLLFNVALFVPSDAVGAAAQQPMGSCTAEASPLCSTPAERRAGYALLRAVVSNVGFPDDEAAEWVESVLCRVRSLTSGGGSLLDPWDRWDYDPSSTFKSVSGYAGLVNPSCTCYINAVLQQLFALPAVRATVLSADVETPAPVVRGAAAKAKAAKAAAAEAATEQAAAADAEEAREDSTPTDAASGAGGGAADDLAAAGGAGASAADDVSATGGAEAAAGADAAAVSDAKPDAEQEAAAKEAAAAAAKAKEEAKKAAEALAAKRDDFLHEHRLLFETQRAFLWMQETGQRAFNPLDLIEQMRILGFENIKAQNDATELLQRLLARLEISMTSPTNVISMKHAIAGQTSQYLERPECCKQRTLVASAFYCLEMQTGPEFPTLESALAMWAKDEHINGFNCDLCGAKDIAVSKHHRIRRLPDTFMVLLNRNGFDPETGTPRKINDEMSFPPTLDMAKFTDWATDSSAAAAEAADLARGAASARPTVAGGPDNYELTGVVVHRGTHTQGHYMSYIKAPVKGQGIAAVPLASTAADGSHAGAAVASAPSEAGAGEAARSVERKWLFFDDASVTQTDLAAVVRAGRGGVRRQLVKQGSIYSRSKKAIHAETNESAVLLIYSRSGKPSEGAALGNARFLEELKAGAETASETIKARERRQRLLDAAKPVAAGATAAGGGAAAASAAASLDADSVFPPDYEVIPSQLLIREELDAVQQANRDARVVSFRFDPALAGFLGTSSLALKGQARLVADRRAVSFLFDTLMRSRLTDGPDAVKMVDGLCARMAEDSPIGRQLAAFAARFVLSEPALPGSVTPEEVVRDGFTEKPLTPLPDVPAMLEAAEAASIVDLKGKCSFSSADLCGSSAMAAGAAVIAAVVQRSPALSGGRGHEWVRAVQSRLVTEAVRIRRASSDDPEGTADAMSGAPIRSPLAGDVVAELSGDASRLLSPAAQAELAAASTDWEQPAPAGDVPPGLGAAVEGQRVGLDSLWLGQVLMKNKHDGTRRHAARVAAAALRVVAQDPAEADAFRRDMVALGVAAATEAMLADAMATIGAATQDFDDAVALKAAITAQVATLCEDMEALAPGSAGSAMQDAVAMKRDLGIKSADEADKILLACTTVRNACPSLRSIMPNSHDADAMARDLQGGIQTFRNIIAAARKSDLGLALTDAGEAAWRAANPVGPPLPTEVAAAQLQGLADAAKRVFAGASIKDVDPREAASQAAEGKEDEGHAGTDADGSQAAAAAAAGSAAEADVAEVADPAVAAAKAKLEKLRGLEARAQAQCEVLRARSEATRAAGAVIRATAELAEPLRNLPTSLLGVAAAAMIRPLKSTHAMVVAYSRWGDVFDVLEGICAAAQPEGGPAIQWPPPEAEALAAAAAAEAGRYFAAALKAEAKASLAAAVKQSAKDPAGAAAAAAAASSANGGTPEQRAQAKVVASTLKAFVGRLEAEGGDSRMSASAAAKRIGLAFTPWSLDWRAAKSVARSMTGPGSRPLRPGCMLLNVLGAPQLLGRLYVKERLSRQGGKSGAPGIDFTRPVALLEDLVTSLNLPVFPLLARAHMAMTDHEAWLTTLLHVTANSTASKGVNVLHVGVKCETEVLLMQTRIRVARHAIALQEGDVSRAARERSLFDHTTLEASFDIIDRNAASNRLRGAALSDEAALANANNAASSSPNDADTDDDADSTNATKGGLDDGDVTPRAVALIAEDAKEAEDVDSGRAGTLADATEDAATASDAAAPGPASPTASGAAAGSEDDFRSLTAPEERKDVAFFEFDAGRHSLRGPPSDPDNARFPLAALRFISGTMRTSRASFPGYSCALLNWMTRLDEVQPGLRAAAVRALFASSRLTSGVRRGANFLDSPPAVVDSFGRPGRDYETSSFASDTNRFFASRAISIAELVNTAEFLRAIMSHDLASAKADRLAAPAGGGEATCLASASLGAMAEVRAALGSKELRWWALPFAAQAPLAAEREDRMAALDDIEGDHLRPDRMRVMPEPLKGGFMRPLPAAPRGAKSTRVYLMSIVEAGALLRAHSSCMDELLVLAALDRESAAAAAAEAASKAESAAAVSAEAFARFNEGSMESPADPEAVPTFAELSALQGAQDNTAARALAMLSLPPLGHPSRGVPPGLCAGLMPVRARPADLLPLAPRRVLLFPGASATAIARAEADAAAGAAAASSTAASPAAGDSAGEALAKAAPAKSEAEAGWPAEACCSQAEWESAMSRLPEAHGRGLGFLRSGMPAGWFATWEDPAEEQSAGRRYATWSALRPGHVRRPLRSDACALEVQLPSNGFQLVHGVFVAANSANAGELPVFSRTVGPIALSVWRQGVAGMQWCIGVRPQDSVRRRSPRHAFLTGDCRGMLPTGQGCRWEIAPPGGITSTLMTCVTTSSKLALQDIERFVDVDHASQRSILARGPTVRLLTSDDGADVAIELSLARSRFEQRLQAARDTVRLRRAEAGVRARRARVLGRRDPVGKAGNHSSARLAGFAPVTPPGTRSRRPGGRSGTPRRGVTQPGPVNLPPIQTHNPIARHGVSTELAVVDPPDAAAKVAQAVDVTGKSEADARAALRSNNWDVEVAVGQMLAL